MAEKLKDSIDQTIIFAKNILNLEKQTREDYKEFLELVIIFLGGPIGNKAYKFRKPGATHRTRWMTKGLYSLKMWMCQDHFDVKRLVLSLK